MPDLQSPNHQAIRSRAFGALFNLTLILLIGIGLFFRFSWTEWHQGASLHPDEYGLTNTLTQLRLPDTTEEYFNTRLAPLSPYQKYDVDGAPTQSGPDNRLRWGQWPIILIRTAAELSGQTGYDEIRVLGRRLSAVADSLSLLLIYWIGKRLYSRRAGLMAAALSGLAVMQIQQSHFMTVDNFALLFTMLAMGAAVWTSQRPLVTQSIHQGIERSVSRLRFDRKGWIGYTFFGAAFGMALASRINLLPLAGMIVIAAFLSAVRSAPPEKLRINRFSIKIASVSLLYLTLAALAAGFVFRLTQPMTFRAPQGNTGLLTLHLNPDWVESMKVAQNESRGIGGGPPGEQWANRTAILFPLMNMVVWGMGLPLGISAWIGFLWASWETLQLRANWRAHLLPLVWVGGYFLFMGTRWVKSIRYFLPIYPFLALLAAWMLLELWQRSRASKRARVIYPALSAVTVLSVLGGTFLWANAFVDAVYRQAHTRIQASRWIQQNIPAPFTIRLQTASGKISHPIPAPEILIITGDQSFTQSFILPIDGEISGIVVSKATNSRGQSAELHITIAMDDRGEQLIAATTVRIPAAGETNVPYPLEGQFEPIKVVAGQTYYLTASTPTAGAVKIYQLSIANEHWDESLPVPLDGHYPFGSYYRGLTMQVRWYDDENKRSMFLETLAQADYVILPSQRAIWTTSRIPLTYPMTLEYYRALFDGRLGFELVAHFQSPWKIGPLYISDLAGTAALGQSPELPLFNNNPLAAEEAFSVYDHPPVWIFKKRADFDLEQARQVLEAVDLEQVVIQSPREATPLEDLGGY